MALRSLKLLFPALLLHASRVSGQTANSSIVSIPYQYTYLLPDGFANNVNESFVNGTSTSNSSVNSLLKSAATAPFISYDDSFLDILGSSPQPRLIQQRDTLFAYEAGVWVPERNEVWFSTAIEQSMNIPGHINVFNLNTSAVYPLNGTSQPIYNPNGAYYFEGKVYFATYPGNSTYPGPGNYRGGVISVDARTLEVETVVNSYFGLPFNSIDDTVWVTRGNDRYMFFSDLYYDSFEFTKVPIPSMPNQVWRWDPQQEVLLPVINRNEASPNGVRVSPDMRTLYVTDNTGTFEQSYPFDAALGPAATNWLGPYIYKYDLDEEMMPVNRRVFGLVREGIADGLHVDDDGNVWTGESEGVVVRNPKGKVIGVFNAAYFQGSRAKQTGVPIANFALAGDTLVIGGVSALWTVKLGKTVVRAGSSIVN